MADRILTLTIKGNPLAGVRPGVTKGLKVMASINVTCRGVVGIFLVAFDWWVRDYVLKNKAAFEGVPSNLFSLVWPSHMLLIGRRCVACLQRR